MQRTQQSPRFCPGIAIIITVTAIESLEKLVLLCFHFPSTFVELILSMRLVLQHKWVFDH
jgi:hypothetical protein